MTKLSDLLYSWKIAKTHAWTYGRKLVLAALPANFELHCDIMNTPDEFINLPFVRADVVALGFYSIDPDGTFIKQGGLVLIESKELRIIGG